jgi:hypothetical protein
LEVTALAPVALAILSTAGLTVGLMQWLLKPQFDAVNNRVDELKADIRELRAAVYVPRNLPPPPEADRQ